MAAELAACQERKRKKKLETRWKDSIQDRATMVRGVVSLADIKDPGKMNTRSVSIGSNVGE